MMLTLFSVVKYKIYLKNQNNFRLFFSLILGFISFLISNHVAAESYGLKFYGQEVKLDERTELNLTPDGFIKFKDEFEITFNYKITSEELNSGSSFFGYILRMINQEGDNIDLLNTPPPNIGLNLVIGKTNSSLPIEYTNLDVNKWIKLRVKVLLNKDRLILYTPDSLYVQDNIGLKKEESFKIIFGANDYKQFKNSDVPSMAIKDLKVFEKGRLRYYWPLNEVKGNFAQDKQKGKEALVKNPFWLKYRHQNWQVNYAGEVHGYVTVTQDIENGKIFMVGTDKLYIYSTDRSHIQEITYKNKPLFLSDGSRAIYNTLDEKIYCYHVGKRILYTLNVETGEWNRTGLSLNSDVEYRHHNSFFNDSNNSIYIFGGYGFHRYKNDIFKVDLTKRRWQKLPSNDSVFSARYLAGLGSLNDTLYILGGYGSETGNQLINPHSYFDLLGYSIRDSSLFHKFKVPRIMDDMVVANSMWIDEKNRDYYALVFEKSKYNCFLRLVKGNLAAPEIAFVGGEMPFKFLDVRSFASLFYDPQQNKLFAYTSYFTDSATTQINIHSINYPPNETEIETIKSKSSKPFLFIILLITIGSISVIIIWLYWRKRKRKEDAENLTMNIENIPENNEGNEKGTIKEPDYQLILFGGFQVFNSEYKDITNKFSPILKELFLLILLYTFKNNKGVSSEKIEDILWYDKSEKSARNNRAVNIAKLRSLMNDVGSCDLSKETGYWKIKFEEGCNVCDYLNFIELTLSETNLTKQKTKQLIKIVEKGGFLHNLNYEWLDDFKSHVSDVIVSTLIKYGESCDIKKDTDFIVHLSDTILTFDFLSEEALIFKCRALYYMGKRGLAKETYDKFFKTYMSAYDEEYERTFQNILGI